MRRITLDIETTGGGPIVDPATMELTLVGIHDSETDTYSSYIQEELPQLWPILEQADLIIGYNSDHFDIPILNRYYAGDLTKIKSLDLLVEIRNVLGRRLKLDSIAKATLGKGKSGSGLDAVKWWQQGKIDKIRKYCLDDVRITKEIYEYAKANGKLKYSDFGTTREIPIEATNWESAKGNSITHTLPF